VRTEVPHGGYLVIETIKTPGSFSGEKITTISRVDHRTRKRKQIQELGMGFGTRKNIHIENWAAFRENCEYSFKFSRANWARLFVFGIGFPVLAYVAIATEMVRLNFGHCLPSRLTCSN
jgi:hypothetical protein